MEFYVIKPEIYFRQEVWLFAEVQNVAVTMLNAH